MDQTITIEQLIEEMKPLVEYRINERRHYMGSTILTNREMDAIMCVTLGDVYTLQSSTKRAKMRKRVFRECV